MNIFGTPTEFQMDTEPESNFLTLELIKKSVAIVIGPIFWYNERAEKIKINPRKVATIIKIKKQ